MSAVALGTMAVAVLAAAAAGPLRARLLLSRAKHRSLQGHARLARWLARRVPFYEFDDDRFFSSDGAPATVAQTRRAGFARLALSLGQRSPDSVRATGA